MYAMRVTENKVVSVTYTLRDWGSERLDTQIKTSRGSLLYLHGSQSIFPDLERALEGKAPGERVALRIPPERAYGNRDGSMIRVVPRELFPEEPIEVGEVYQAIGPDGEAMDVVVVEQDATSVTVDGNHPLAGHTLEFDATVVEVREATDEEIAQGRVIMPVLH